MAVMGRQRGSVSPCFLMAFCRQGEMMDLKEKSEMSTVIKSMKHLKMWLPLFLFPLIAF